MAFIGTAVMAVGAAIEVTTVASVLAAVSAVGAATSVVGMITGNKDLIKIGGIMGIAGGVGSLANGAISAATSAGAEAAGAGAIGEAASGVADGAMSFSDAGFAAANPESGLLEAANNVATIPPEAMPSGGIINQAMSQPEPVAAPAAPQTAAPTAGTPAAGDLGSGMYQTPVDNSTGIAKNTPSTDFTSSIQTSYPGAQTVSGGADAAKSIDDGLFTRLGKMWKDIDPKLKAEIIKSALAIPGGIQTQQNKAAELAINQQKINQTSYGSSVPTFGIINKAKA